MLNLNNNILKFSRKLISYDNKAYSIYYYLGKCSLRELMKFKSKNKIQWKASDLIYLTASFL